jgi:hypothetical protein
MVFDIISLPLLRLDVDLFFNKDFVSGKTTVLILTATGRYTRSCPDLIWQSNATGIKPEIKDVNFDRSFRKNTGL